METNNLNLCELLKGHEGEMFYCSYYGEYVKLITIGTLMVFEYVDESLFNVYKNGSIHGGGECMIFPSKDQRDWNKWIEEQKAPKTWSELVKQSHITINLIKVFERNEFFHPTTIEKSALALLKIHQLIEVGYGGNVTEEELEDYTNWKYKIYVSEYNEIKVCNTSYKFPILFHTKEQAKEFLSYPENAQLAKDFYMI